MLSAGTNRLLSVLFLLGVAPLLGLYALLMYISRPSESGGIEPTMSMVASIALTVIFSVLTIVVVNFSRQLGRQAKGEYPTP